MKIILYTYDPKWAIIYSKEKQLLQKALGNKAVRFEHVGSTSVPGLGAKPVIDILLGVYKLADAEEFIPKMLELGYEYITKYEDVMPDRRYFVKKETANTLKFHVHTFELATEHWKRHIMFRDYLRINTQARDEYYKLKKDLSFKDWSDANDYAGAKTKFIRDKEFNAYKYFTVETEKAECDALFEIYDADKETKKRCGITVKRFGVSTAVRTDIFPGFSHNRVTGLGLDKPLNEDTILEIKKFFADSPNKFALQLSPLVIDKNISEKLNTHGFVHKNNWVRFYRDTSPLFNVKTGLEIKAIGMEHAEDFGSILMRNFDFPMDLKNAFNHNIGEENWKHYMTFYKNIPAGAGAVFFNGDTAWIGFAATEPEYRGKGSQAAILSARIDEARKRRCKWISVETAEDSPEHDAPSYRNMLRFGFNFMYKRPNFVFEPVKA